MMINEKAREKAKELGMFIADSKEMKNLKESEMMVQQDEKARMLVEDYNKVQLELMKGLRSNLSKEEIEELKSKLQQKLREVNEYSVTRYFFDSKKEFDSFIRDINNIMTYEITGKGTCDGHSCTSCDCCH